MCLKGGIECRRPVSEGHARENVVKYGSCSYRGLSLHNTRALHALSRDKRFFLPRAAGYGARYGCCTVSAYKPRGKRNGGPEQGRIRDDRFKIGCLFIGLLAVPDVQCYSWMLSALSEASSGRKKKEKEGE